MDSVDSSTTLSPIKIAKQADSKKSQKPELVSIFEQAVRSETSADCIKKFVNPGDLFY